MAKLTDTQIYTLRRMMGGTKYFMSADCRKGDEDRSSLYETRRVNAPSIPVLFRHGLIEWRSAGGKKEKGKWYGVQLTQAGRDAALLKTSGEVAGGRV